MADIRPSFPSLEDSSTGAGLPLHKVLEGDASAAKNASAALVAKKADGTLRYLNLDDAGNLQVTTDGGGTNKKARGKVTGSQSVTTVVDLSLTALATYHGLSWVVSCFRDAVYEFVLINDPAGTPTETILADALVGAGDLTDSGGLKEITFTAGATDPVLRVRAFNLNATTSDFRAAVSTTEDAA